MLYLEKNLELVQGIRGGEHMTGILKWFTLISSINRGSKNEKEIADFIVRTAGQFGHEWQRDEHNNVVVYLEPIDEISLAPLCLQSHIDMVPADKDDKLFDTSTIEFMLADGKLSANQTSLGADNGIGVATMLYLMERGGDFFPGLVELLFTSDEETGLHGAKALNPEWIKSKRFINLDSEALREVVIGCAGGAAKVISLPFGRENKEKLSGENFSYLSLKLEDLLGGHSGVDISETGGNALVWLSAVAIEALEKYRWLHLIAINGGTLMNAIPRSAIAEFLIDVSDEECSPFELLTEAQNALTGVAKSFPTEKTYKFSVDLQDDQKFIPYIPDEMAKILLAAILGLPNGVLARYPDSGLLKTSSNLAIVKTAEKELQITIMYRSSFGEDLQMLEERVFSTSRNFYGSNVKTEVRFSIWEPKTANIGLLAAATKTFALFFDQDFKVLVSHGGLESGALIEKCGGEAISIGPTIEHPHTSGEYVVVDTIETFAEILLNILNSLTD